MSMDSADIAKLADYHDEQAEIKFKCAKLMRGGSFADMARAAGAQHTRIASDLRDLAAELEPKGLPRRKTTGRFRWRRIYGAGLAWESVSVATDDLKWIQLRCVGKVFVGPLTILFDFPLSPRTPNN